MNATSSLLRCLRVRLCPARVETGAQWHVKVPNTKSCGAPELRRLRAGRWQKVIKQGNNGEVHYFEHSSGHVAGVKFFIAP